MAAAVGCRSASEFAAAEPTKPPLPTLITVGYDAGVELDASRVVPAQAEAESIGPPAELDQPEELAAESGQSEAAEPEPLEAGTAELVPVGGLVPTLDDVVRSVVEFFPVIQQATEERGIAYGKVLEASGAFDRKLDAYWEAQPLDFYENYHGNLEVKKATTWGGQTFAGYKIGRGTFEPWYLERETNDGGELKAGFVAPIIGDINIDANRSELWQAQVEQTRAEVTLQAAVIAATRDAAASYWDWVAAGEKLRIAEWALQLGVRRIDGIKERIAAGEDIEIDEVDNRRVIVSRQAKVIDAQRKLRQAAAKLSLYLRGPAGEPVVTPGRAPSDTFGDASEVDSALAGDGVSLAQENRPEPRTLELTAQQLGIAIRQASNETLHNVDAGLLVGQDFGGATSADDKGELEVEARFTWSVPLERRKAFGKLRQLRGKLAQVRAKERLVRDKISIEVEVARAALEAAAMRVEQTTQGVGLARQMVDATQTLYEEGAGDLFSLNIREKQAADAELERVDALLDYHLAAADYAAALGVSQTELSTGLVQEDLSEPAITSEGEEG